MSEGLKALENILKQELIKPNKYRKTIGDIASTGQVITIQKELKEHEQYKAIEEELGIDLMILLKSIKNGFWAKDELGNIFFISSDTMKSQYEHNIEALKKFNGYYGKTWALTKEELL